MKLQVIVNKPESYGFTYFLSKTSKLHYIDCKRRSIKTNDGVNLMKIWLFGAQKPQTLHLTTCFRVNICGLGRLFFIQFCSKNSDFRGACRTDSTNTHDYIMLSNIFYLETSI